jgi:hypothetical protein
MKPVHIRLPNSYTAAFLHDLIFRGIGVVCCFLVFMIIISSVHAQSARETQSQKSLITQRVETLRQVRDIFREIAASPLPPSLSAEELAEAKHYVEWLKAWAARLDNLAAKGESASGVVAGGSGSQERLLMPSANKQRQEMSESFNLQYLQLQNQISDENRRFALVYTIMKNKHDTAKNAIGKLR